MQRAATRLGLQGYSFVSKSAALAARDAKQLAIEEHVHESLALFAAVSQVLHTFYLPLEQFFLRYSITTVSLFYRAHAKHEVADYYFIWYTDDCRERS